MEYRMKDEELIGKTIISVFHEEQDCILLQFSDGTWLSIASNLISEGGEPNVDISTTLSMKWFNPNPIG